MEIVGFSARGMFSGSLTAARVVQEARWPPFFMSSGAVGGSRHAIRRAWAQKPTGTAGRRRRDPIRRAGWPARAFSYSIGRTRGRWSGDGGGTRLLSRESSVVESINWPSRSPKVADDDVTSKRNFRARCSRDCVTRARTFPGYRISSAHGNRAAARE